MTAEPADEGSTEFADRPIQLYSCRSVARADQIKAMLESHGIRVFLVGDSLASSMPHLAMIDGGVKIYVPLSQLDEARCLMHAAIPQTKGTMALREAAERGEVECPKCAGRKISYGRGLRRTTILLLLLLLVVGLLILPFFPRRYICQTCDNKWYP